MDQFLQVGGRFHIHWGSMSRVVRRLQPFAETVFATMTAKAVEHKAVNLGQGFPEEDGPRRMLEIAGEQILAGNNQYSNGRGTAELRRAVAADRERRYGITYDPESEVLITVGATEAITASVLGLVEPGSEVIVLEPYYDVYAAAIALAGATRVAVPLQLAGDTWELDVDLVAQAVTERTAMIIVNSPHNPTGSVFSREALTQLAKLAIDRDLLVLTDEVYEHLVYDAEHVPLATLPGMRERTITVSSAAKTFNVTGWKTGWALGAEELIDAVIKAKQFITFVGCTPVQPAVAYAIENEQPWIAEWHATMVRRRDELDRVLRECGFRVFDSRGTYFTVVDIADITDQSGLEFCMSLPEIAGVAAIPVAGFTDHPDPWRSLVRFTYCKPDDQLAEAERRLKAVFGA